MEEYKFTVDQERRRIRKILKETYPGCRTYIKAESDNYLNVRVVHDRFATQDFLSSICEVLDLLTDVERIIIVEPICQETWESRRW